MRFYSKCLYYNTFVCVYTYTYVIENKIKYSRNECGFLYLKIIIKIESLMLLRYFVL